MSNKPPEKAEPLCPELYEKLVHPRAQLLPEECGPHSNATRATLLRQENLQEQALLARAKYEARWYVDSLSDSEVSHLADQAISDVDFSDINPNREAYWYLRGNCAVG